MNAHDSSMGKDPMPSHHSGQAAPEAGLRPLPLNSRRSFLKWSAGALLAAGYWPGARPFDAAGAELNRRATPAGTFRFIAINDLHHMSPECSRWLEGVVDQIRHQGRIAFTLVLGDLTDRAEKTSFEEVKRILGRLRHRSYVQIGNHDYASPEDASAYNQTFPGRLNYDFTHRGWQFVGVDTTQGQRYEKTQIQAQTLDWVKKRLASLDPAKPTVLFTHFPLAEGVQYRPQNAESLLELFRDYNLKAVFSGHYHASTERLRGECSLSTNRCCALKRGNHDGSVEKGFLLCEAGPRGLTRSFVEVKPI